MLILPKKIGGESPLFFSYKSKNHLYHRNSKKINYFISGRNAILEIIRNSNITHIFFPFYYCYPVLSLIKEIKDLKISYYRNHNQLINNINKDIKNKKKLILFVLFNGMYSSLDEYLDIINSNNKSFYTLLDAGMTPSLKNVNSNFDYTITNPRKFYRLSIGTFLYSTKNQNIESNYIFNPYFTLKYLITKYLAKLLLCSRINIIEKYGLIFNNYSELNVPIRLDIISFLLIKNANFMDLSEDKVYQHNLYYKFLKPIKSKFYFKNKASKNDCPFGFIIQTDQRDEIKNYLMQNRVFASSLWVVPNELKNIINLETIVKSEKILVLPIGPQYNYFDIKKVSEIVLSFFIK